MDSLCPISLKINGLVREKNIVKHSVHSVHNCLKYNHLYLWNNSFSEDADTWQHWMSSLCMYAGNNLNITHRCCIYKMDVPWIFCAIWKYMLPNTFEKKSQIQTYVRKYLMTLITTRLVCISKKGIKRRTTQRRDT